MHWAKIRNSIVGNTRSVCSWLSCHHALSHFSPPINPIKKCLVPIIEFVCTLKFACACTHGSKKTFCYLSSDQSPSGNRLCRPSAASQEAQPSSTRFYDLFIKMNRWGTRTFQFIPHKIPKPSVQFWILYGLIAYQILRHCI